ncbi:MAG: type II secretion system protein [Sideroxydans sp.]|nr:type II secretion system protein [Sideroxydans sp.]
MYIRLPGCSIKLSRQAGISLIELIMFIVIISIALAGILLVMNQVTAHSSDALVRKQSEAIAQSLLEEVELMPFTWCDPNDPSAVSATQYAGCTTPQNVYTQASPATESRGGVNSVPAGSNPYDNVADYSIYAMSPIVDINGNGIAGLEGYSARVAIVPIGGIFLGGAADNDAALRITVTVIAPNGAQLQLDGYRARYAPKGI